MGRPSRVGLLFSAVLLCNVFDAYGQNDDGCRAVLVAKGVAPGTVDNCHLLASFIYFKERRVGEAADIFLRADSVAIRAIFSPRDLQAKHPQQPSLAGTPAQGHALPSVQPAGVAAGSLATFGTDAGQDAMAALGINPAILFLGDEVSRQLARYSRFADLTVFLPVSRLADQDESSANQGSDLEYFGVRLRLNVHGLAAGDAIWARARELTTNWISRAGLNVARVRQTLAAAPSLSACANALLDTLSEATTITANCGATVNYEVDLQEAEALRDEFAKVRRAADSRYFGADVRVDVGDPTMGAVENAAGNFLFAGLSYGRRLSATVAQGANYGFRARLGARHAKLDVVDRGEFALEGGLGFEIARHIEAQEINASVAVEFREGSAPANLADQFQNDFVLLRGSLLLPITTGNSLSINFGAPIAGDVSAVLSVNFNWGLLLPDRPGR